MHPPPLVVRPEPGRRGGRRRGAGDVPPHGPGPAVPPQADHPGRAGAAGHSTGQDHLTATRDRALPDQLLQKGKEFALSRNPYFHEWSAPAQPDGFLDAITWTKVADTRTAADAVRHDRADLAELTPLFANPEQSGSLVDALKIAVPSLVHPSITQTTEFGVLDSATPPFDNTLARQAVNYAVDRREAVRLMGGDSVATATCQLVPPSMPSYRAYCPYTRGPPDGEYHGPDLRKARELVAASGTEGMRVTVTDLSGDYNPPLDAYLAEVLRKLGYRVTLRPLPDTLSNEDWFYGRATASRSRREDGSPTTRSPRTSTSSSPAPRSRAATPSTTATRTWTTGPQRRTQAADRTRGGAT